MAVFAAGAAEEADEDADDEDAFEELAALLFSADAADLPFAEDAVRFSPHPAVSSSANAARITHTLFIKALLAGSCS
jgi:hypothetical protein